MVHFLLLEKFLNRFWLKIHHLSIFAKLKLKKHQLRYFCKPVYIFDFLVFVCLRLIRTRGKISHEKYWFQSLDLLGSSEWLLQYDGQFSENTFLIFGFFILYLIQPGADSGKLSNFDLSEAWRNRFSAELSLTIGFLARNFSICGSVVWVDNREVLSNHAYLWSSSRCGLARFNESSDARETELSGGSVRFRVFFNLRIILKDGFREIGQNLRSWNNLVTFGHFWLIFYPPKLT